MSKKKFQNIILLQHIRSFISSKQHALLKPELSPLEKLMTKNYNNRKCGISLMYN